MTIRSFISTSIRRLAISLALLTASTAASAQMKFFTMQKDYVPMFRGFSVSFDLVGAGMLMFSDYGQYEGALRINLQPFEILASDDSAGSVAITSPSIPFFATIPATIVTNAAVGPAICTRLPPKKDTRNPATIAV